jgi:hypothetical protein
LSRGDGKFRSSGLRPHCPGYRRWSSEYRRSPPAARRRVANVVVHGRVSTGNPGVRTIHYGLAEVAGHELRILRTILLALRTIGGNRGRQPRESSPSWLWKGSFPNACFTAGISGGGRGETADPTDGVVRFGQRAYVHQAGWLAPSGGACRADHVGKPVGTAGCGNRCLGYWAGNVTATLNSCAVGLVDPEFPEPRL